MGDYGAESWRPWMTKTMKAVVYDKYGSTDVLRVAADVPVPTPDAGQVRVKIAATSVNRSDWEGLTGSPLYARLGGLRAPGSRTLGSDIAGWIDSHRYGRHPVPAG